MLHIKYFCFLSERTFFSKIGCSLVCNHLRMWPGNNFSRVFLCVCLCVSVRVSVCMPVCSGYVTFEPLDLGTSFSCMQINLFHI